jgi:LPXTG-motif cell wall-anchored protein
VGSRLVLGATRKVADQFFGAFSTELDPGAVRIGAPAKGGGPSMATWLVIAGVLLLLLAAWFLVR